MTSNSATVKEPIAASSHKSLALITFVYRITGMLIYRNSYLY